MKNVQIRSFFWFLFSFISLVPILSGVISGPYFALFTLNGEKYGPEINMYLETFQTILYDSISAIPENLKSL